MSMSFQTFEAPAKDLAKQSGSKTVAQDNVCWLRLLIGYAPIPETANFYSQKKL